MLLAVSQTGDPTGTWNLYSVDTSDDGMNGTPATPGCPCLPDQPLLGANRDGVFIYTNEFQDDAQLLLQRRPDLRARPGARWRAARARVVFDSPQRRHGADRRPEPPVLGIDPARRSSVNPRSGTELLMTGGPEDDFQNNAPLDNRIAAWSLTGTGSLNGSTPGCG